MTKKYSIRQHMIALTLLPLLLLALLLESFLLHGHYADLDQALLDRGLLLARQLASTSEYAVFANNRDFLQSLAQSGLNVSDVRGVMIINADEQVLVEAGQFSVAQIQHRAMPNSQLSRTQLARTTGWLDEHTPLRNEANKILIYQAILPSQVSLDEAPSRAVAHIGAVIIEMSKQRVQNYKQRIFIISLAVTIACLLLSFYLMSLASRRITRPIKVLSDLVANLRQGDLHTPIVLTSNIDELASLIMGMQKMTLTLAQDHRNMQQQIDVATQGWREKKEQAERATQQKSVFLAVASHDLRQPLHALGLYTAELQRTLAGSAQQPLVERIEQSVDALTTLLNALLDLSKLDAGAVVPQWQSCNVSLIVNRIANDYRMLAQMKKIRFVVHPCHGWVHSDPVLLERILMNLVSNAVRYTRENGCVMIACRKRGNQLRIEVRDNGVGISAAHQTDIFREFSQVQGHQLDSNKGLGLGLAIVDRLVHLLGHGMEVKSKLQHGSVFALQAAIATPAIPLENTGSYASYKSAGENTPLLGKRLLVVDDDELVLTSTATILESWGGKVFTSTSLAGVQQLLMQGESWDLIISDYQLSATETGMDVITAVRAKLGDAVKGILISGDTRPELLQLAHAAGLHLMHKPVKPAKLRSLSVFLLGTD
ncbi:MAG: ATP-binding protein [Gallionella sp.]